MKCLYKYPQREFPYARLVEENRRRGGARARVRAARHRHLRRRPLLRHLRRVRQGRRRRTSASGSRRSTAGPEPAPLHVLPHLWFRNTWAWGARARPRAADRAAGRPGAAAVSLVADDSHGRAAAATCPFDYRLGPRYLYAPAGGEPLFTDNETNAARVFGPGRTSRKPLRQGRLPPPRHRRRGRASTRSSVGTKAVLPLSLDVRARRAARSSSACG